MHQIQKGNVDKKPTPEPEPQPQPTGRRGNSVSDSLPAVNNITNEVLPEAMKTADEIIQQLKQSRLVGMVNKTKTK